MFFLLLILFIIECFGFCFILYKVLLIVKDIETLYDNYSLQLEKVTKNNVLKRGLNS